jgi:hypothetical protein
MDTYTAFHGTVRLAHGPLADLLVALKRGADPGREAGSGVLVFEDWTGRQVDFDLTGSEAEVLARATPAPKGPGRPKLGVVSREVSLLPRHWEWLEQQPHGLSGALRRLIDVARQRSPDTARAAREVAGKVMWSLAGDLPDFEEASRALFAANRERFMGLVHEWPADVRGYVTGLAEPSFAGEDVSA